MLDKLMHYLKLFYRDWKRCKYIKNSSCLCRYSSRKRPGLFLWFTLLHVISSALQSALCRWCFRSTSKQGALEQLVKKWNDQTEFWSPTPTKQALSLSTENISTESYLALVNRIRWSEVPQLAFVVIYASTNGSILPQCHAPSRPLLFSVLTYSRKWTAPHGNKADDISLNQWRNTQWSHSKWEHTP